MSEHPLAAPLHSIARACTSWGDHSYAEACRQAAATLTQQMRTITSLEAEARQSAAAREAQHREIGRLRRAIREIEELATDTPDEATQEGALDSIRSCCEGALVAEQENPNANR